MFKFYSIILVLIISNSVFAQNYSFQAGETHKGKIPHGKNLITVKHQNTYKVLRFKEGVGGVMTLTTYHDKLNFVSEEVLISPKIKQLWSNYNFMHLEHIDDNILGVVSQYDVKKKKIIIYGLKVKLNGSNNESVFVSEILEEEVKNNSGWGTSYSNYLTEMLFSYTVNSGSFKNNDLSVVKGIDDNSGFEFTILNKDFKIINSFTLKPPYLNDGGRDWMSINTSEERFIFFVNKNNNDESFSPQLFFDDGKHIEIDFDSKKSHLPSLFIEDNDGNFLLVGFYSDLPFSSDKKSDEPYEHVNGVFYIKINANDLSKNFIEYTVFSKDFIEKIDERIINKNTLTALNRMTFRQDHEVLENNDMLMATSFINYSMTSGSYYKDEFFVFRFDTFGRLIYETNSYSLDRYNNYHPLVGAVGKFHQGNFIVIFGEHPKYIDVIDNRERDLVSGSLAIRQVVITTINEKGELNKQLLTGNSKFDGVYVTFSDMEIIDNEIILFANDKKKYGICRVTINE